LEIQPLRTTLKKGVKCEGEKKKKIAKKYGIFSLA